VRKHVRVVRKEQRLAQDLFADEEVVDVGAGVAGVRGAHAVAPASALAVRPSRIARAGLGLFAATDIAAHTLVCEYSGAELSLVETALLGDCTYLMGGLGFISVDAREHRGVLARYINDGGAAGAQNARFVKLPSRRRACVVAKRDIRAGEEIYASYGPIYWADEAARDVAPGI